MSLLMAACGTVDQTPAVLPLPSSTVEILPTETVTPTPFQPSPTPAPLAARVNQEEILLSEFQAELDRFHAAEEERGARAPEDAHELVINDLINQVLLAQGARENGFRLEEETLENRIAQLVEQVGGEGAFSQWLVDHGYAPDSFRAALKRSLEAAWMRDQILSKLPDEAEQVYARQILLYNSDQAREVLEQLKAGNDFATLAARYNPTTMGVLGWFPRGYLTVPELEESAFSLQPGEFSDVIESSLGFHIIQVMQRDPARPLEPDALLVYKTKALQDWLDMKRVQSEIEIMLAENSN